MNHEAGGRPISGRVYLPADGSRPDRITAAVYHSA
jgi:hypothetical protein